MSATHPIRYIALLLYEVYLLGVTLCLRVDLLIHTDTTVNELLFGKKYCKYLLALLGVETMQVFSFDLFFSGNVYAVERSELRDMEKDLVVVVLSIL